jgi:hypothetical protein
MIGPLRWLVMPTMLILLAIITVCLSNWAYNRILGPEPCDWGASSVSVDTNGKQQGPDTTGCIP